MYVQNCSDGRGAPKTTELELAEKFGLLFILLGISMHHEQSESEEREGDGHQSKFSMVH